MNLKKSSKNLWYKIIGLPHLYKSLIAGAIFALFVLFYIFSAANYYTFRSEEGNFSIRVNNSFIAQENVGRDGMVEAVFKYNPILINGNDKPRGFVAVRHLSAENDIYSHIQESEGEDEESDDQVVLNLLITPVLELLFGTKVENAEVVTLGNRKAYKHTLQYEDNGLSEAGRLETYTILDESGTYMVLIAMSDSLWDEQYSLFKEAVDSFRIIK